MVRCLRLSNRRLPLVEPLADPLADPPFDCRYSPKAIVFCLARWHDFRKQKRHYLLYVSSLDVSRQLSCKLMHAPLATVTIFATGQTLHFCCKSSSLTPHAATVTHLIQLHLGLPPQHHTIPDLFYVRERSLGAKPPTPTQNNRLSIWIKSP
jgi:hypothetical protein